MKKALNFSLHLLLIIYIVSLRTAFAQEINGPTPWEVVGNMYSQPNIHKQVGRKALDYYGSGDVNNNEEIDSLDNQEILGATNDRADIDGDGTPGTQADKLTLDKYLNGEIDYFPGHWNELKTPEERISWIEKVLKIQDMTPYLRGDFPWNQGPDHWVCANYIEQMQIDFNGISNIDEFIEKVKVGGGVEYNPENNARFNLPFYHVQTKNASDVSHGAGGFFIGDGNSEENNVLNFDDWYFVNYYQDDRLFPGEFDMNENEYAKIGLRAYLEDRYELGRFAFDFVQNLVKFNLENGEGKVQVIFRWRKY